MTRHFPNMPYFEILEFWERRINPVIEGDHSAVVGKSDRISRSTPIQHFDHVVKRN